MKEMIVISIWITLIGSMQVISGCRNNNSIAATPEQGTGYLEPSTNKNDEIYYTTSIYTSSTWRQNPDWIARNYDLQGRPKLLHRIYYDYYRFRRQKVEQELAERQADSLREVSDNRDIAATTPALLSDTVVEVQKEFTGYKPQTISEDSEAAPDHIR